MKPHCAVGYLSGFLSLSSQREKEEGVDKEEREGKGNSPALYPSSLTDEERKKMVSVIELSERMNNGGLTIPLRWCLLYADDPPRMYCNHLYQSWSSRPPSFEEFHHYLRGYFEIVDSSKTVNHTQVKLIMAEMARVVTPLPPRYQSLFFELGDYVFSFEGKEAPLMDVTPLVDSLQARSVDFSPLVIPKREEEREETVESGDDPKTEKGEETKDGSDVQEEASKTPEEDEVPPSSQTYKKKNPPRKKKA